MVGLIPLFAVETLDSDLHGSSPRFQAPDGMVHRKPPGSYRECSASMQTSGMAKEDYSRSSILEQLRRMLRDHVRRTRVSLTAWNSALSRHYHDRPFTIVFDGQEHRVDYEPGESTTGLFGGNSNWRGPVWFPVNYLLIESLQKFHHYFGDDFKIEFPSALRQKAHAFRVAAEFTRPDGNFSAGRTRQAPGLPGRERTHPKFPSDSNWSDLILFYEYFHGDTGQGLGASHQTGWTALVTKLLQQGGHSGKPKPAILKPAASRYTSRIVG